MSEEDPLLVDELGSLSTETDWFEIIKYDTTTLLDLITSDEELAGVS